MFLTLKKLLVVYDLVLGRFWVFGICSCNFEVDWSLFLLLLFLFFVSRAKTIQNKVSQNVTRSVEELLAIIKGLKEELIRLKVYCTSLDRHILGLKSGEIDLSEDTPVRFRFPFRSPNTSLNIMKPPSCTS
jgi:hypothetical protein